MYIFYFNLCRLNHFQVLLLEPVNISDMWHFRSLSAGGAQIYRRFMSLGKMHEMPEVL